MTTENAPKRQAGKQESIGKFTASASGVLHVLLAPLNAARHAHRLIRERGGRPIDQLSPMSIAAFSITIAQLHTQTSVQIQSKGHSRESGIRCSGSSS